ADVDAAVDGARGDRAAQRAGVDAAVHGAGAHPVGGAGDAQLAIDGAEVEPHAVGHANGEGHRHLVAVAVVVAVAAVVRVHVARRVLAPERAHEHVAVTRPHAARLDPHVVGAAALRPLLGRDLHLPAARPLHAHGAVQVLEVERAATGDGTVPPPCVGLVL